MSACKHCGDPLDDTPLTGNTCVPDHAGLCCDCFDLSCGMPLTQINEERAARGEPPITREWSAK